MRPRLTLIALLVAALALAACNLSTQPPATATPAPVIPEVHFVSPPNNSTVIQGTDLEFELAASDKGIGIAKIELRVDDQKVNEKGPEVSSAVPVFTVRMNWLAQGLGRHAVTAIAYRPDGTQSDVATLVINVLPGDTPTAGS
jgi:hypothetical protein